MIDGGGCVGLREKVEVTRRYLRFVFPVCRNDFVMLLWYMLLLYGSCYRVGFIDFKMDYEMA